MATSAEPPSSRPQRPKVSRLGAPAVRDLDIWGLPRGAHSVPAGDIEASQRARILYAIVHAVAEKGYAAATIADITRIARLSRSTFYDLFGDKESCFLAAYEAAHYELVDAVVGSQTRSATWAQRLRESLRAYLRYNRDNPAIARCFLVEIHAAGQRAWAKRDWGHEIFGRMQKSLYQVRRAEQPGLPDLPDEIFLAMVAAVEEMVCAYVRNRRTESVMGLEPRALFVLEAVYGTRANAVGALRPRAPRKASAD